ncbi:hypothetical protein U1707_14595 [Sphingomonas sp. PB2P12]
MAADPKLFPGVEDDMADPNDRIHVETDDARAGATPHMTRYILAVSLVLVIAIFGFLILR